MEALFLLANWSVLGKYLGIFLDLVISVAVRKGLAATAILLKRNSRQF